ncbi:MAG TPA: hypothetical protein VLG08_09445 [Casimicrobiaceae bacterium]|jgi:hypothetical protein|nr:hypothetical protein [Casimicrobiaceae bacterium]
MKHRVALAVSAIAFAAVAAHAGAQTTPAESPAAPASSAPVPKPECGAKPGEYPGNLASDNQKRSWQKDFVAYIDCLKKFIQDQQALADPHVKAANAAISEYNAGVKAYNDEIQKAKGG